MEIISKSIGSLAIKIKTGSTPKTEDVLNFEDANFNWFTPGDFSESKITLNNSSRKISEYAVNKSATVFEPKTILITCIGDIGNSGIIELNASSNQQITGVLVNEEIINPYLFNYLIRYNKKKLQSKSNQAVVPILNNKNLKEIELSFPKDLETQNKIVAILDKAKAILDKREKTIQLYDELLRATFLEMFGNPCNPNREDLTALDDLILEIKSGWSPVCEETPRLNSNQTAILKQGAVSRRSFDATQNKLLPEGLAIKKAVYAEKSNLLFSRKNTPELVGASAYVFEDFENLLLPDTIFKLYYDIEKTSGIYLYFLFNDVQFRKKIQSISVGQAKSMSNISQERLLQLNVPVPAIEKQKEFEEIVLKTYNSFYHKIKKSQSLLSLLLNSISQEVFSERIIIDIDIELEALIDAIDLSKKDEENKIGTILNDVTFIQRLIDRLNEQQFEDKEQYDKAKYILFRMMKEEEGLVKQVFKNNKVQLTLQNETT